MRYRYYTAIAPVLTIALVIVSLAGAGWQWTVGLAILLLISLLLIYRSVHLPLQAVENGIWLLREQDFSSHLSKTGQTDADKVVELYNSLMDSMKRERLKNLEQHSFLSQLIEASPMGIAVCDFDRHIVQTNRAWQIMQSDALQKALATVKEGEIQTVRLEDALIVRISRLWFMDSGFRRQFILVEKLTEEIFEAEKQLFHKIVRTIGHEVNNTLGSVMSVLENMAAMHSDDSLTHDAIESSRNSCDNLVEFVKGYSDIVKRPPLLTERSDINSWLKEISPSLYGILPDNISLKLNMPDSSLEVDFDQALMERVLVNIVKNAVESIGDKTGGKIGIAIDNKLKKLTVTDNGPGISPENATKIFTPFFSTKRTDRGLGLMLVSDILHSHHFSFSLTTSEKSGLTIFTIRMK